MGELAIRRPIVGELPRPSFPDPLERWRGRAGVALMFAQLDAATPDAVCRAGMLAGAVAERRARFADLQTVLARPGATSAERADTMASVSSASGAEPLSRA